MPCTEVNACSRKSLEANARSAHAPPTATTTLAHDPASMVRTSRGSVGMERNAAQMGVITPTHRRRALPVAAGDGGFSRAAHCTAAPDQRH